MVHDHNGIYGMTGGQTAPTTPYGVTTVTSPYGSMEHPFDIAPMVAAAGASYVARYTTVQPRMISGAIKKGLQKTGFALIEVVSQCPVQFGRVSKMGKAVDMLKHFKANSVKLEKAKGMTPEELTGKIVVGEFANRDKAELATQWVALKSKMVKEASSCHSKN